MARTADRLGGEGNWRAVGSGRPRPQVDEDISTSSPVWISGRGAQASRRGAFRVRISFGLGMRQIVRVALVLRTPNPALFSFRGTSFPLTCTSRSDMGISRPSIGPDFPPSPALSDLQGQKCPSPLGEDVFRTVHLLHGQVETPTAPADR